MLEDTWIIILYFLLALQLSLIYLQLLSYVHYDTHVARAYYFIIVQITYAKNIYIAINLFEFSFHISTNR